MKRVLKWLAVAVAIAIGAIVLFVLSGYLLPAEVVLELEQTVPAPPDAVYTLFTTYEGVERWWHEAALAMGDELEVTHLDGPVRGVGMHIGFGTTEAPVFERWTYTSVEPPRRVEIVVDFQIFESHRVLELSPDGTGTKVLWRETAQIDSPIWRWMLKLTRESAMENRRLALSAAGAAARERSPAQAH